MVTVKLADAADIETVRRLFRAYAGSLPFSLEFQGFPAELAGLPGPYVPPDGCLLLAIVDGLPAGVGALKKLAPGIAEIKRLFVEPAARGRGLGRRLAERAIAAARAAGYSSVRLDTHRPSMTAAIALYRRLGFVEIPPYGPNPGGELAFFEKALAVTIRAAAPEDAAATCVVLRRSIIELCVADHHNDPAILDAWLRNKTPEIVGSWIVKPGNTMLLAIDGDAVLGVGSVTNEGEITLNYVSPEARFGGVSRMLIAALEKRAAALGNASVTLTSTGTAQRFYRSIGYAQTGPAFSKFAGSLSYPMAKRLRE